MGNWISVDDRLPSGRQTVLIWGSHRIPWVGSYHSRWMDASDGEYIVNVTHWMPLPAPPEGDDPEYDNSTFANHSGKFADND